MVDGCVEGNTGPDREGAGGTTMEHDRILFVAMGLWVCILVLAAFLAGCLTSSDGQDSPGATFSGVATPAPFPTPSEQTRYWSRDGLWVYAPDGVINSEAHAIPCATGTPG